MVVDNSKKLKEYNKVNISTSNQEALILKCYDGTIASLKIVLESMGDRKQIERTNQNMIKAQKGLALLADSINTNAGGEIADNLLRLYDFMIRSLTKAGLNKDTDLVKEVLDMVTDLRDAWMQAFDKLHQEADSDKGIAGNARPQHNVLNIVG